MQRTKYCSPLTTGRPSILSDRALLTVHKSESRSSFILHWTKRNTLLQTESIFVLKAVMRGDARPYFESVMRKMSQVVMWKRSLEQEAPLWPAGSPIPLKQTISKWAVEWEIGFLIFFDKNSWWKIEYLATSKTILPSPNYSSRLIHNGMEQN